jgi:hypothetical protein
MRVEYRALALYDAQWRKRPTDLDLQLRVADGHERLAQMYALRFGVADSALLHIDLAQRMVEAVAASDPSDHSLAIDAMDGRVTRALILATLGRVDEASRVIAATRPTYEKWAAADTSDTHFRSSLPELYLAQAIVDRERARSANSAARASAWRTAQASYDRAERAYGFDAARERPSGLMIDIKHAVDRGRAECDSAVATQSGEAAGAKAPPHS